MPKKYTIQKNLGKKKVGSKNVLVKKKFCPKNQGKKIRSKKSFGYVLDTKILGEIYGLRNSSQHFFYLPLIKVWSKLSQ